MPPTSIYTGRRFSFDPSWTGGVGQSVRPGLPEEDMEHWRARMGVAVQEAETPEMRQAFMVGGSRGMGPNREEAGTRASQAGNQIVNERRPLAGGYAFGETPQQSAVPEGAEVTRTVTSTDEDGRVTRESAKWTHSERRPVGESAAQSNAGMYYFGENEPKPSERPLTTSERLLAKRLEIGGPTRAAGGRQTLPEMAAGIRSTPRREMEGDLAAWHGRETERIKGVASVEAAQETAGGMAAQGYWGARRPVMNEAGDVAAMEKGGNVTVTPSSRPQVGPGGVVVTAEGDVSRPPDNEVQLKQMELASQERQSASEASMRTGQPPMMRSADNNSFGVLQPDGRYKWYRVDQLKGGVATAEGVLIPFSQFGIKAVDLDALPVWGQPYANGPGQAQGGSPGRTYEVGTIRTSKKTGVTERWDGRQWVTI